MPAVTVLDINMYAAALVQALAAATRIRSSFAKIPRQQQVAPAPAGHKLSKCAQVSESTAPAMHAPASLVASDVGRCCRC